MKPKNNEIPHEFRNTILVLRGMLERPLRERTIEKRHAKDGLQRLISLEILIEGLYCNQCTNCCDKCKEE